MSPPRPDAPGFRRLPHPGWAWPTGDLDTLLRAAVLPDNDIALTAFRGWLSSHDIDRLDFREHRLLAGISERFGKALEDSAAYPRLVGLQRQLWTRSRMSIAEALPVLRALADEGIPVMLLKGAARIAAHPQDQKARVAHDIDILVRPARFAEAVQVLFGRGWKPSSGESHLALMARGGHLRAINFFGGRFGDIDLHRYGYDATAPQAEAALWRNAAPHSLLGQPVLVPAPTDRLALAIWHSGLDAHSHSDWLVDCAHILLADPVDWPHLTATLIETSAVVPAQVALSYLAVRLGVPLPDGALNRLLTTPDGGPLMRLSHLLQARPRSAWGPISRVARGIAKQARLRRVRATEFGAMTTTRGHVLGRMVGVGSGEIAIALATPEAITPGPWLWELTVAVNLPPGPRRVELELNTADRHLCRLRFNSAISRKGPVRLSFRGRIDLTGADTALWLASRPGRHLRGGETAAEVTHYAALPVRVLTFTLRPAGSRP